MLLLHEWIGLAPTSANRGVSYSPTGRQDAISRTSVDPFPRINGFRDHIPSRTRTLLFFREIPSPPASELCQELCKLHFTTYSVRLIPNWSSLRRWPPRGPCFYALVASTKNLRLLPRGVHESLSSISPVLVSSPARLLGCIVEA